VERRCGARAAAEAGDRMKPCRQELTLREVLADPMIRALMSADRVNPGKLEACLNALSERLRRRAEKM
jgi:hypothetical protein